MMKQQANRNCRLNHTRLSCFCFACRFWFLLQTFTTEHALLSGTKKSKTKMYSKSYNCCRASETVHLICVYKGRIYIKLWFTAMHCGCVISFRTIYRPTNDLRFPTSNSIFVSIMKLKSSTVIYTVAP